MKSISAIHIVHNMGIGGVEEAVRSFFCNGGSGEYAVDLKVASISDKYNNIDINKNVVFLEKSKLFDGLNNVLSYLYLVYFCIKSKPDVVVCSLWRSVLIGLLLKPFYNGRLICFLHNEKYKNNFDEVIHRLGIYFFDGIFSDSERTIDALLSAKYKEKSSVISFVTKPVVRLNHSLYPKFIFWGRLVPQKNIKRACRFFSTLKDLGGIYKDSSFFIIGPDGGDGAIIHNVISAYGLESSVFLLGPQTFAEIKNIIVDNNISFYLQLSDFEGMAMSVVEAMSLGLVPIVTPVGEIINYVEHTKNGFLIDFDNEHQWYEVVKSLPGSDGVYRDISTAAHNQWLDKKTYREDFCSQLNKIF